MTEQQISQDEKKQNFFMEHQKLLKISFIVFIISLVFYLYIKIHHGYVGDFFMGLFSFVYYTLYIIYCTFVTIVYKKILIYNLIAFALLSVIVILNCTGFSYTRGHYLSKAEQIDIGLESGYLYTICFDEGWKGEKLKDCPYTLAKLKIEYPQCFTDDRPDDCGLYQYKIRDDIPLKNRFFGAAPVAAIYSEQLRDLTKSLYSKQYCDIFPGGVAGCEYDDVQFFDKKFKIKKQEVGAFNPFVFVMPMTFNHFGYGRENRLNKTELIDLAIKAYIDRACSFYVYDTHNKTCPLSFEMLKQEAPQCFEAKRENICKAEVTNYNVKNKLLEKKEIVLYRYSGLVSFFMSGRVFDIYSQIGDDGMNYYAISQSGRVHYAHDYLPHSW